MTSSKLVLREVARRDISEAVSYYVREAGHDVALGFIDEVEQAFAHVLRHHALNALCGRHSVASRSRCSLPDDFVQSLEGPRQLLRGRARDAPPDPLRGQRADLADLDP